MGRRVSDFKKSKGQRKGAERKGEASGRESYPIFLLPTAKGFTEANEGTSDCAL